MSYFLEEKIRNEFGNGFTSNYHMITAKGPNILKDNSMTHFNQCRHDECQKELCYRIILVPKVQSVTPSLIDKITLVPEMTPIFREIASPKLPLDKVVFESFKVLTYFFLLSPIPYLVVENMVKNVKIQKKQWRN